MFSLSLEGREHAIATHWPTSVASPLFQQLQQQQQAADCNSSSYTLHNTSSVPDERRGGFYNDEDAGNGSNLLEFSAHLVLQLGCFYYILSVWTTVLIHGRNIVPK